MRIRSFILLAIVVFGTVGAQACSIPVFRYALDRWPADPYALEISATDAKDPDVARFLRNFTDNAPLNVAPKRTQEEGMSRLGFPHEEGEASPAWSGVLDSATLPTLTTSPARAELVRRILAGDCAVWLLVESGDRAADDSAAALLEKRLHYLEQVAQIPVIDPDDPSSELGPGPALGVKLSVLRVKHDDIAEQPFLKMLAGPKTDATFAGKPWLALVFGRGRVLGAWPSEGFGNEQIDEASLFLLAACSCQVKRMNPGWDLLLDVDWNESLQAIGFPAPKPATEEAPPVKTVEVAAADVAAPSVAPPEPSVPAPAKVETVTIAPVALVATAPSGSAAKPAAIAACSLLLLGGVLAWRTMHKS